MKARILTAGSDEYLVDTRVLILARSYEAAGCPPEKVVELLRRQHFDLLLVCHSISHEDGTRLIAKVHEQFPSLLVLRIISELSPPIARPISTKVVLADFRPEVWIRAVDEMLSPSSPSFQ